MTTPTLDLLINQGTTWTAGVTPTFDGVPIDDTWTARAQVRARATDTTILHTFACTVEGGTVKLSATPAESAAWAWTHGVYDVKVSNADETIRFRALEGSVRVSPGVTR